MPPKGAKILTAAQWDEIQTHLGSGSAREVAERMGFSRAQVADVWNGTRKRPGWVQAKAAAERKAKEESEKRAQEEAEKRARRVASVKAKPSKEALANGRTKRCDLSTVEQVDLFHSQGDVCYLCREFLDFDIAHVDHDHAHEACQGQGCRLCVRGLAHTQCNTGVGLFADNPDRMREAAKNLEQASEKIRARWSASGLQDENKMA